jgi:hypothetical protein
VERLSSEITGLAERAGRLASSTGPEHGRTALANSPTESASAARQWLLAQASVAEADKALQTSLQSQLGVGVKVETRMMFPENGKPYPVPSGSSVAAMDPDAVNRAVSRLQAATAPADHDQVEAWVIGLQVATAGGKRSEAGTEAAFNLYTAALRKYPADVAREACNELATGKWFPTLGELIAVCDKLSGPRQAMLTALQNWKPQTERERLTELADEWLYLAYAAEDDALKLKRRDPDQSSERAEFAAHARSEYRRLSNEARQA